MKKKYLILIIMVLIYVPSLLFGGIEVKGSLTHEYSAKPGESYTGGVIIQNSGTETEEVKLYLTDYSSEVGGKRLYSDPGTNPRSNTSWIILPSERITISAGESYTAYFTVNIPGDQTLTGTYWSLLMVEAVSKESVESSKYNPKVTSVGVQTKLRYGIRMISNISNTGTIQPEIVAAKLMKEEDKVFLSLDITNKGTSLVRINSWAELYTEDGEFTGKFQGDYLAVFPGSSIRFRIDFVDVPKNKYLALIVLDCGDNNVFGINYDLVFE